MKLSAGWTHEAVESQRQMGQPPDPRIYRVALEREPIDQPRARYGITSLHPLMLAALLADRHASQFEMTSYGIPCLSKSEN